MALPSGDKFVTTLHFDMPARTLTKNNVNQSNLQKDVLPTSIGREKVNINKLVSLIKIYVTVVVLSGRPWMLAICHGVLKHASGGNLH